MFKLKVVVASLFLSSCCVTAAPQAKLQAVAAVPTETVEEQGPNAAQDSGTEETASPIVVKTINEVNEDGSYTYGYEATDGSFKLETRQPDGTVKGRYGFVGTDGKLKTFEYTSRNGTGFEVTGDSIPTQAPPPAAPAPIPAPAPQVPEPLIQGNLPNGQRLPNGQQFQLTPEQLAAFQARQDQQFKQRQQIESLRQRVVRPPIPQEMMKSIEEIIAIHANMPELTQAQLEQIREQQRMAAQLQQQGAQGLTPEQFAQFQQQQQQQRPQPTPEQLAFLRQQQQQQQPRGGAPSGGTQLLIDLNADQLTRLMGNNRLTVTLELTPDQIAELQGTAAAPAVPRRGPPRPVGPPQPAAPAQPQLTQEQVAQFQADFRQRISQGQDFRLQSQPAQQPGQPQLTPEQIAFLRQRQQQQGGLQSQAPPQLTPEQAAFLRQQQAQAQGLAPQGQPQGLTPEQFAQFQQQQQQQFQFQGRQSSPAPRARRPAFNAAAFDPTRPIASQFNA